MSFEERVRSTGAVWRNSLDSEARWGLLLILPAIALFVATLVYPFFQAFQLSLQRVAAGEFVGLANYRSLLAQDLFWGSLYRSVLWTVGNIALQGVVGVLVALLLARSFFGRNTIRTAILVPFVIPTAVTAILWRWLLNGTYGPINAWLREAGLITTSITPLTSPDLALATVTLINTWRWAPLVALIVFAVLQTIPEAEYEAAKLEGAGIFRTFYHVTYPHLKGALSVLGLLGFLITFNIFDMIWLLTNGGPANATTTLPVFIYEVAFNQQSIGRGTAASVLLFLILLAFVVLLFHQSEIGEGEPA